MFPEAEHEPDIRVRVARKVACQFLIDCLVACFQMTAAGVD